MTPSITRKATFASVLIDGTSMLITGWQLRDGAVVHRTILSSKKNGRLISQCDARWSVSDPESGAVYARSYDGMINAVARYRALKASRGVFWPYDVAVARQRVAQTHMAIFNLIEHLRRQRAFSERAFGPGQRLQGVLDHIRKELVEVEESGGSLSEWVDVILLAFDGAWRAGSTPEQIALAIARKQAKNETRRWPDWRTADPGKAIEHIRGEAS